MNSIKTLNITGYRSFELGIFQDKDPKVTIIKKALKNRLISYLESGLEWVIIGGNLGVEFWAAQVVQELKVDYPELKLGLIFPFYEFGSQWNENNQAKLAEMKNIADYENATSHHPYQSPSQLRGHTKFLIENTEGSLLLYDTDYPGKTEYFLKDVHKYQEKGVYFLELINMYDLQELSGEQ